jgi:hypothetical protein
MITRQQYMNKKATHREYYSQFVTDDVKQRVKSTFKMKDLIEGKNQHFIRKDIRASLTRDSAGRVSRLLSDVESRAALSDLLKVVEAGEKKLN